MPINKGMVTPNARAKFKGLGGIGGAYGTEFSFQ